MKFNTCLFTCWRKTNNNDNNNDDNNNNNNNTSILDTDGENLLTS